jgi:hypothetical protein
MPRRSKKTKRIHANDRLLSIPEALQMLYPNATLVMDDKTGQLGLNFKYSYNKVIKENNEVHFNDLVNCVILD